MDVNFGFEMYFLGENKLIIVDTRVYSQCLYYLQCITLCSIAKVTSSSITHFGKLFQQACHCQGERMPEVWTYLVRASTVALHDRKGNKPFL